MSGITLKRSARALRIVSLPASVRPTGSGPRDSQKVASSVKNETMRSTSRLLKAAEIAFMSSGVARSLLVVEASGMRFSVKSSLTTIAGLPRTGNWPDSRKPAAPDGETGFWRRCAWCRLLRRDAARAVYGHLHRRVAAHRGAVPQAVRALLQVL